MRTLFILIAIFCSCNSYALSSPKGSKSDDRIQSITNNPNDVVKINVADGFVSAIVFDQNESILDVVAGFPSGYEFKEAGNILYLKPKSINIDSAIIQPVAEFWDTNILVTTTKQIYAFDLIVVDQKDSKISYRVNINYPQNNAAAKMEKDAKKDAENLNNELISLKTPRNWDYFMKIGEDSSSIVPSFTYDDGQFTYIGFEKNASFPAVFLYENGKETILNTHIKYDANYQILVVQKLAPTFVLRSGDRVVGIFNQGFNKISQQYQTTSSPNVERAIYE